jgi:hypothetical protein
MPSSLTAAALAHRTPEHGLLGRMSTVVMAMEVEPATECLCATSRKGAAEDEDTWVGCWVDGADVGGNGRVVDGRRLSNYIGDSVEGWLGEFLCVWVCRDDVGLGDILRVVMARLHICIEASEAE